jgi:tetratricopeptide (TPR) repeat protein
MLAARERLAHLETAPDHLVVARTHLDMGSIERALPHLARALEIEPESLSARFLLGRSLLRLGQIPAATAQLAVVVQQDETHAWGDGLLELAAALEHAGHDTEALSLLERHAERIGANRRAMLARARILGRLGRRDEARALLVQAAEAPPTKQRLSPDEALARARARVALWRGGR